MPAIPTLDEIITEVDAWFAEHLRRPPIAHDVLVYNQAYAAAERLKVRLAEMFTGKPATPPVNASAAAGEPSPPAKAKPTE